MPSSHLELETRIKWISTFLFNKTGISSNDHRVIHEFAQGCFRQVLGQHNNAKVQNLLHVYNNNYENFIVYYGDSGVLPNLAIQLKIES